MCVCKLPESFTNDISDMCW